MKSVCKITLKKTKQIKQKKLTIKHKVVPKMIIKIFLAKNVDPKMIIKHEFGILTNKTNNQTDKPT